MDSIVHRGSRLIRDQRDSFRRNLRRKSSPAFSSEFYLTQEDEKQLKYVVLPSSSFRKFANVVTALLTCLTAITLPLSVAFPLPVFDSLGWRVFDIFMDVYFWADIALNFRTAYVDESGHLKTDSKAIAQNYIGPCFKGWFIIDLLGAFPLELILADNFDKSSRRAVKLSKVFKLSRLLRFARIIKLFRNYFKFRHVLSLMSITVFLFHWCSCGWFMVESSTDEDRWLAVTRDELDLTTLYFSLLNQVTAHLVGIGVVQFRSEENTLLLAFSVCMTVISGVLHALIIATLSRAIATESSEQELYRIKINSIVSDMQRLKLPRPLQIKIKKYYDYLWVNQLYGKVGGEASVVEDPDLSSNLRHEVSLHMARSVVPLRFLAMFQSCSDECLSAIVLEIRQHVFMAEEFICQEGDTIHEIIYVAKGCVWSKDEAGNKVVQNRGTFFGQHGMVLNDVRHQSPIQAIICTELSVLSKTTLFQVLEAFQTEKETAQLLRMMVALPELPVTPEHFSAGKIALERKIAERSVMLSSINLENSSATNLRVDTGMTQHSPANAGSHGMFGGVNPDAFNPLTPGSGVAFTPRRGFPDASSSQPRVPISSQGLSPDKDSDAVRSALACLSPAGGLEEVLEGTLEADGDVEKSESGTMDTNEPDETKEAADTIQRTPAKSGAQSKQNGNTLKRLILPSPNQPNQGSVVELTHQTPRRPPGFDPRLRRSLSLGTASSMSPWPAHEGANEGNRPRAMTPLEAALGGDTAHAEDPQWSLMVSQASSHRFRALAPPRTPRRRALSPAMRVPESPRNINGWNQSVDARERARDREIERARERETTRTSRGRPAARTPRSRVDIMSPIESLSDDHKESCSQDDLYTSIHDVVHVGMAGVTDQLGKMDKRVRNLETKHKQANLKTDATLTEILEILKINRAARGNLRKRNST